MKVSILIPAYNVEKYLPTCLDSVLGQTYQDLQVVIIDDGSKDRTLQVCRAYSEKDDRVEYYSQENQGVAATRNHLLEKVKGDYVLFIDADDWMELDMVDFLMTKIIETQADLVTCGNVINNAPISIQYNQKFLSRENAIERFLYHLEFRGALWNKIFNANILHNCRFNTTISLGEDALFCWHVLQHTNSVIYTDRQLYHYRMNDCGICHSTFGPRKMSAHYAWEQICTETNQWCPQNLAIAQARHCIEDVLLLRDAIRSNYPNKPDIKLLQSIIFSYWSFLLKVHITSFKMKVFALIVSKFSSFAKFF